jgi:hypothetical protein
MSTEATGDGKPDTVGTAGPDAGAELAEPAATAVDEPAAEVPRQAGARDEAGDAGEAPGSGEVAESGEAAEAGDVAGDVASESGEGGEPDEGYEADEGYGTDEADEPDGDYDERANDDVPQLGMDDEALEYDEDYEGYESEKFAQPQRARRWPRLLLALGFVVLAAAIIGGAIAIVGSLTHGFKKPVKITYKSSPVFSLKTGDCFDPQGQQSFTLLSCDSPHQAEVFATFALTGTNWPGAAAVQAEASGGCSSRLTGYVNPQLAISLSSTYVYPDSVAWQAGTRTVICEVRATSGELIGSVRGASASAGTG